MSTVSKPNTFSANTVISPSEVNSNFDTIYNEFNGNISAANLATSAVSTAKIADAAVTGAKIAANTVTYANVGTTLLNGWIDANETWTYASGATTNVGTFTVTGDVTSKYQAGDKIQFTQTTVKYAIITKVSFSSSTTITIYMGTDYTIANAAITSPMYSHSKSPVGFPMDPLKWSIETSNANDCVKTSPVSGTWYGDTGLSSTGPSITLPIGAWRVYYETHLFIDANTAADVNMSVTLSTGATTESDTALTGTMRATLPSTGRMRATVHKEKYLTMTASTPYYLNIKAAVASMTSIAMQGSTIAPLIIRAVCAYL